MTGLIFLLLLSVLSYGVGILLMVQETAGRSTTEREIRVLTGRVSLLEEEYLAAAETITLERAHALGFIETKEVVRIARKNSGIVLTLQNKL